MVHFRESASIPLAVAAVFNPVWIPTPQDISPWLSIFLQMGGLMLIAAQLRYWWKKK